MDLVCIRCPNEYGDDVELMVTKETVKKIKELSVAFTASVIVPSVVEFWEKVYRLLEVDPYNGPILRSKRRNNWRV
jgi:hypothetical protein